VGLANDQADYNGFVSNKFLQENFTNSELNKWKKVKVGQINIVEEDDRSDAIYLSW